MNQEKVLVIPKACVDKGILDGGFTRCRWQKMLDITTHDDLFFMERSDAETNQNVLQLIPYMVIQDYLNGKVFSYQRGKSGGEDRLHSKISIGIGGHVNEFDVSFYEGMRRELREEVGLQGGYSEGPLGLIYDPSTDVGSVHLGIAIHVRCEIGKVSTSEDCISNTKWVDVWQMRSMYDRMEKWSQLVHDYCWT